MRFKFLVSAFFLISFTPLLAQQRAYRENVLIIKVRSQYKAQCTNESVSIDAFNDKLSQIKGQTIFRKFPSSVRSSSSRFMAQPETKTDISLIYEVRYEASLDPIKAAIILNQSGVLAYAEPAYISTILEVPNDPLIYKQWHLAPIRAFEAWDVQKGSDQLTIGVIDTGIDWDHPDLVDAIDYNENDPIDGLDNDDNGYVDDYRGWNFYDGNNDPDETSFSHGTHVSGLAGAVTNNGVGVAGVSYNCRILPIKAGSFLELTHGYEGIVYAVEMGVDIINCSWGSTNYTAFGEDIVNYATESGILVVCGAGNNSNDYDFYPGAFGATLNVGATDSLNQLAGFTSFYYAIDIAAPGQIVFCTKNGTYNYESGTSMSSPIVAGAAALVKLRFPQLTPAQIKAQLMATANPDVYLVSGNEKYRDRLGTGLLDMRAALDSILGPAIELDSFQLTDHTGDRLFVLGESGSLGIELINQLGNSGNVTVTLRSMDSLLLVTDSVRIFSSLSENEQVNNFNNPFHFEIVRQRGYNERVDLQLVITDGAYSRNEYVTLIVNPDFVNVTVNDIASTVSSVGHIGYANNQRSYGLGFELSQVDNFLYEAGLMISAEHNGFMKVTDRVRGEDGVNDRDFWPISVVSECFPEGDEAFCAMGQFSDTSANKDEIGLEVRQSISAYDKPGHRNYMVVEYTIKNVSDEDLNDVFVGVFADWDILNSSENKGQTVFGKRLGRVYATGGSEPAAAIQSLNMDKPFKSYMIDNSNGGGGGVDISGGGFTTDEKRKTMTENRFEAGGDGPGSDISQVAATGGYRINVGDSITVAFALMAAESKAGILSVADSAFKQYNGFLPGENVHSPFQFRGLFPNPTQGSFQMEFDLQQNSSLTLELFSLQGQHMHSFGSYSFFSGPNILNLNMPLLASGIYLLKVNSEEIERSFQINYHKP